VCRSRGRHRGGFDESRALVGRRHFEGIAHELVDVQRQLLVRVRAHLTVTGQLVVEQKLLTGEIVVREIAVRKVVALEEFTVIQRVATRARCIFAVDREILGRHVTLQNVARTILLSPLPEELRQAAVHARHLVLLVLAAIDVGEQLVVLGLIGSDLDGVSCEGLRLGRIASRQQGARDLYQGDGPIGFDLENALVDLHQRFDVVVALEFLGDEVVFGNRLLVELFLPQQLRDLDPTRRIGGIDGRHLAQQVERFALLALLVESVRRRLQRVDGLGGEPHALVELREGLIGLESIRIEIEDLLEDRDGPRVEALLGVLLGDFRIGLDRLLDLPPTPMGVADLEAELGVLRVEFDELLVFLERLFLGALLGQLARRLEDFSLIRCQRAVRQQNGPRRRTFRCSFTYRLPTGTLEIPVGGEHSRPAASWRRRRAPAAAQLRSRSVSVPTSKSPPRARQSASTQASRNSGIRVRTPSSHKLVAPSASSPAARRARAESGRTRSEPCWSTAPPARRCALPTSFRAPTQISSAAGVAKQSNAPSAARVRVPGTRSAATPSARNASHRASETSP
jgi:hypothetical protein